MVIEFLGTPCSGKTSVIKYFTESAIVQKFNLIEESVLRCPISDDKFEQNVIWTIIDTFLVADNLFVNGTSGKDIIFDRGLLDRLIFAKLLGLDTNYYDLSIILQKLLLSKNYFGRIDHFFLFLTSYNKVIYRKNNFKYNPNSKYKFTNKKIISSLNNLYFSIFNDFKHKFPIHLIDERNEEISVKEKFNACKMFLQ